MLSEVRKQLEHLVAFQRICALQTPSHRQHPEGVVPGPLFFFHSKPVRQTSCVQRRAGDSLVADAINIACPRRWYHVARSFTPNKYLRCLRFSAAIDARQGSEFYVCEMERGRETGWGGGQLTCGNVLNLVLDYFLLSRGQVLHWTTASTQSSAQMIRGRGGGDVSYFFF